MKQTGAGGPSTTSLPEKVGKKENIEIKAKKISLTGYEHMQKYDRLSVSKGLMKMTGTLNRQTSERGHLAILVQLQNHSECVY